MLVNQTVLGGDTTPVLLNTKNIDDNLNYDEFNAIMYLLRKNTNFKEKINIENGEIKGEYGTYVFNLDSLLTTDQGFAVTDESFGNPPSIKLINPLFGNSKYSLLLKITCMNTINIGIGETTENEIVTEFPLILKENNNVYIPISNFNDVIDFEASIVITHDIPNIRKH